MCSVILLLLLILRLVYLQIQQYDHYKTLAENNRISLIPTTPQRGLISDRNGIVLAQNFFAYTLDIIPSKTADLQKTIVDIGKIITISSNDIKRFNKLHENAREFVGIPIRTHLNDVEIA